MDETLKARLIFAALLIPVALANIIGKLAIMRRQDSE